MSSTKTMDITTRQKENDLSRRVDAELAIASAGFLGILALVVVISSVF